MSREYVIKTGMCPMCDDCPDGCPIENQSDSRNRITNADRIRNMSDEELAMQLAVLTGDKIGGMAKFLLEWLRQTAKEDE